jgi:hypothetical protein
MGKVGERDISSWHCGFIVCSTHMHIEMAVKVVQVSALWKFEKPSWLAVILWFKQYLVPLFEDQVAVTEKSRLGMWKLHLHMNIWSSRRVAL